MVSFQPRFKLYNNNNTTTQKRGQKINETV